MVQALCTGEEFSIDVFCDFDGRCLNAIPRTMIESKGGESIKGMTIFDPELIELGRRVAEALPLKGPGCVQCFREPTAPCRSPTSTRASAGPSPLGRRRQPLPGARDRAGERRAPRATSRRVPPRGRDDALWSEVCLTVSDEGRSSRSPKTCPLPKLSRANRLGQLRRDRAPLPRGVCRRGRGGRRGRHLPGPIDPTAPASARSTTWACR